MRLIKTLPHFFFEQSRELRRAQTAGLR